MTRHEPGKASPFDDRVSAGPREPGKIVAQPRGVQAFQAAFHVDGIPKPQPRTKAFRRGAHASVYDPGTANGWKVLVAAAGREHRPAAPLDGAVAVEIDLRLPRPKRLCRKRDDPGAQWAPNGGDADNYAKAILDCLTQDGWWRDDSQVVRLAVEKRYHGIGARPGAAVRVTAWGGNETAGAALAYHASGEPIGQENTQ